MEKRNLKYLFCLSLATRYFVKWRLRECCGTDITALNSIEITGVLQKSHSTDGKSKQLLSPNKVGWL